MKHRHSTAPAKFGTVLGHGPGDVPVYSSDYDSADDNEFPNRQSYRSVMNGVYLGHKWQCVELARRWMYLTKGYVFDDIAMAYDIFRLRHVRMIADGSLLPLQSIRNGARRPPEPGCLLIWNEGGEFEVTGHVAVVTEVASDWVRCIEQNVEDSVWREGEAWSRQLPMHRTKNGGYWIDCTFADASILGWVIQSDDPTEAEKTLVDDPALFQIKRRFLPKSTKVDRQWLDPSDPMQANYIKLMHGQNLSADPADMTAYYCISETAMREVRRATNELHRMFLHATNFALANDQVLERFNLPSALWPRIRQSWSNRRSEMITGRFDVSVRPDGIKAYEYNADSASCYMEAGFLHGRWAEAFGCKDGRDPAARLLEYLIEAWRDRSIDGLLHIMLDHDLEESYHAQFMHKAIEAAGIRCKIVHGVEDLQWGKDGQVLDADGEPILWVWKTWAWETALDEIRHDLEDDEENLRLHRTIDRATQPPRLVDVLLREEVMVFEPLWTLVTSNKAILPIVKQMFPSSRFLLNTAFELTDDLRAKGYAAKPIVGRCGSNIALVNRSENIMVATDGQFDDRDTIYQELFRLPQVDGRNAQIQSYSVDGSFAGAGIRVDRSLIITTNSDLLPLRVLPDHEFLAD
jgi:glutathionylspermidine amidase/synthetase